MDINQITQLISSIGFPIVMCGILAYYVKYVEDKHDAEIGGLRDVINANTEILHTLKQLIEDKLK